jgi:hypothetical protein
MNDNPGKVIYAPFVTRLDIPAERAFANCPALTDVVILGYTHDGEEYFSSSYASGADVLWLLERLKKQLLEVGDD